MLFTTTIRDASTRYVLCHVSQCHLYEGQLLTPARAGSLLRRVLRSHPGVRRSLLRASRGFGVSKSDPGHSLDELIVRVSRSTSSIRVIRQVCRSYSGGSKAPSVAQVSEPEEPVENEFNDEQDWVEFLIADENGEPLANVLCEVGLPAGQTIQTATDKNGIIRFDRIPSGECTIALVDYEEGDWEDA